jgi:hypothetical protein
MIGALHAPYRNRPCQPRPRLRWALNTGDGLHLGAIAGLRALQSVPIPLHAEGTTTSDQAAYERIRGAHERTRPDAPVIARSRAIGMTRSAFFRDGPDSVISSGRAEDDIDRRPL